MNSNMRQPDCQCPSCLGLTLYDRAFEIAQNTKAVVVLVPVQAGGGEGVVASCYEVDLHPLDVAQHRGAVACCMAASRAHQEVAEVIRAGEEWDA